MSDHPGEPRDPKGPIVEEPPAFDPDPELITFLERDGHPTVEQIRSVFGKNCVPVELPVGEIKSLRLSGFLIDPGAADIPRSEGPTFGREGQASRIDAGE